MFSQWIRSLFAPPASNLAAVEDSATEPQVEKATIEPEEQRLRWRVLVNGILTGQAPAGLEYPESVSLAKLRFRSLPASLTVRGDLDLRQCQRLRRIGIGLTVDGDLQIGGRCGERLWYEAENGLLPLCGDSQPPLEFLPELLKVTGQLTLRNCHRLRRLPDQFEVGSLRIEGCHAFEGLPESQTVYRQNLTLIGCPQLQRLPDLLHVQGDLRLTGLPLKELPAGLQVDGNLILDCCPKLTSLPRQLQVAKNLVIRKCPITELPSDMHVGRNLAVTHCSSLTALPFNMIVEGDVRVSKCSTLKAVHTVTRFSKSLTINDCPNLTYLPDYLTVPGILDLTRCAGLQSIPPGAQIGYRSPHAWRPSLVIVDCTQLQSLPDDLKLKGSIDLAGSGLTSIPSSLSNVRVMWRGVAIRPEAVFDPERLSAREILQEPNAEVRRVILERVGCDRVLEQALARTIHRDQDAGGPRRLVDVENARYLQCRCPSTGRVYLLQVPPTIGTCRAAAAWLAGFDNPDDYRPIVET